MMTFLDDLLRKTIIKMARTEPAAQVTAAAAQQKGRAKYVISILTGSAAVRNHIKLTHRNSPIPGERQLAAIIVAYNLLSGTQQKMFIEAYKRRAAIEVGETRYIVNQAAWSDIWLPPGKIRPLPRLGGPPVDQ